MTFLPDDQRITDSGGAYDPAFRSQPVENTRHDKAGLAADLVDYNKFKLPEISVRFRELADKWIEDTRDMSITAEMISHPAYCEILTFGWRAVRLILNELERRPDHWFAALKFITKADPVPEESRGKFSEMREAWLRWGRENEYI